LTLFPEELVGERDSLSHKTANFKKGPLETDLRAHCDGTGAAMKVDMPSHPDDDPVAQVKFPPL
jgi:hypothetical protein